MLRDVLEMRTVQSSFDANLNWKIPSLYSNFIPIIFNIRVNDSYEDTPQLMLNPVI